jgi:putative transposase
LGRLRPSKTGWRSATSPACIGRSRGKPRILEYDQGPEHEAKGIQRGLRLHGITAKVRAKGHPEHHGTIERLIGTMMKRIHERRGTTFSTINERGDTEPDQLACLSLPELEQIVALEIDRYNHSARDGIGDRPLERYLAYYRRPDLADDQRVPPLLPAERLLLDFLPYERRRLVRPPACDCSGSTTARGTCWGCGSGRPGSGSSALWSTTRAAWRPSRVVDDATGDYIAVPYRVPRADMTLAESEAARQRLQALKAEDRTEARLFETVLQVRAVEERGRTATTRMKAERSRQARRAATARATNDTKDVGPAAAASVSAPPAGLPPAVLEPFADVEDL